MKNESQENNEDYKIWYPYEIFYIESMLSITRTAMVEQTLFRTTIEQLSQGKEVNREIIIDSVQNIINYAASISRYFWPSSTQTIHKKRGQKLRDSFDIKESNPLKNRDVRNFIEHFDEKLDLYLSNGISGSVIPSYIGPKVLFNGVNNYFFRTFYTDKWIFKVLNLEYKIIPIIDEIIRIHLLLEKFKDEGGRLPSSPSPAGKDLKSIPGKEKGKGKKI